MCLSSHRTSAISVIAGLRVSCCDVRLSRAGLLAILAWGQRVTGAAAAGGRWAGSPAPPPHRHRITAWNVVRREVEAERNFVLLQVKITQ